MIKVVILLCVVGVSFAEPPVNAYLPGSRSAPSSSYGAPSGGFGSISSSSPNKGFGGFSSQYQSPSSLSSSYGAPGASSHSNSQGGYEDSQPAKYDFKYDVNAPEYNVEFGHQEQRDGYNTQGSYYVVLPDGRRQLVEYTADAEGYKPKISYTEGNGGAGGYGGNSAGGYQSGSQSGSHSGY